MIDKLINFSDSVIRYVNNSFTNADSEIVKQRLEICTKCEHFNNSFCNKCGCFLPVKTSWATEKCPIDKWGMDINNLSESVLASISEVPSNKQPNQIPKDCGCNKNV